MGKRLEQHKRTAKGLILKLMKGSDSGPSPNIILLNGIINQGR